jgi:uncharacterized membrane protein (Fun14 family)
MIQTGTQKAGGLLDKIKESVQLDAWKKRLDMSRDTLIEIGIYLSIGFLSGFLLKKYSKFVFIALLTIFGILALQHVGLISIVIDWQKVHNMLGIQPVPYINQHNNFGAYWQLITENMAIVLSFSGGFLVGLKLG